MNILPIITSATQELIRLQKSHYMNTQSPTTHTHGDKQCPRVSRSISSYVPFPGPSSVAHTQELPRPKGTRKQVRCWSVHLIPMQEVLGTAPTQHQALQPEGPEARPEALSTTALWVTWGTPLYLSGLRLLNCYSHKIGTPLPVAVVRKKPVCCVAIEGNNQ